MAGSGKEFNISLVYIRSTLLSDWICGYLVNVKNL